MSKGSKQVLILRALRTLELVKSLSDFSLSTQMNICTFHCTCRLLDHDGSLLEDCKVYVMVQGSTENTLTFIHKSFYSYWNEYMA